LIPELKLVSEEIVRWAFEVSVNSGSEWKIAFTNPTAGPWKRVLGIDAKGQVGEVHRFEIDEKRPDLILYSDLYKSVVVVEAKTEIGGLADTAQTGKTVALFNRLSGLLRAKQSNPFWAQRSKYKYELALLWGKQSEGPADIDSMVSGYLRQLDGRQNDLLCIQGDLLDNELKHRVFWGKSKIETTLTNYQS